MVRRKGSDGAARVAGVPLGLVAASALLAAPACHVDPPPPVDRTAEVADPLMSAGMERLIPLRFVKICTANPFVCPVVSHETLLRSVQNANQVYRAAGVQLWIRSIEDHIMPDLYSNLGANSEVAWSLVWAELQQVFPAMPWDAWQDMEDKKPTDWLNATTTIYSAHMEILVWIDNQLGNSSTSFPNHGKLMRQCAGCMIGNTYQFAHELGHYLGIRHAYGGDASPDPVTLLPRTLSDRWDLVYLPGTSFSSPHTYFKSRSEAVPYESSLKLIVKQPCAVHPAEASSCIDHDPGTDPGGVTCHIGESASYWESGSNGDGRVKGLGFLYANGQKGVNVVSIGGGNDAHPFGIADSEIEGARKHLRWDVPLDSVDAALILFGYNYGAPALSSRRPRLGSYELREPVHKLDFDADGKRDLGIWEPPTTMAGTGQFKVLLSSNGFSTTSGQYLDVSFGGLGDVPIPADYNGDGRTDVAVFQPGGGINRDDPENVTAYWRWCLTANPPTSTSCASPPAPFAYGVRSDTPQPGLAFDASAGDEISVYRPATGTWHFRNVSGTLNTQRSIGTPNSGVVPLAGLYDCDTLTDLAVYGRDLATFLLRRSEQSWNTQLAREFDAKFIPHPSGTSEQRSGALPLAGMTQRRLCGFVYKKRQSFGVWFPYDGTWNILWSPIDTPTVSPPCAYGAGAGDQIIAGLDRDGNMRSDMALFRATSYDGPGQLFTRLSVPPACNGQDQNVSCPWCPRIRRRVWAVKDMTGDAKTEIMMLEPDSMSISWFTSESDYTLSDGRVLGSAWAIVL